MTTPNTHKRSKYNQKIAEGNKKYDARIRKANLNSVQDAVENAGKLRLDKALKALTDNDEDVAKIQKKSDNRVRRLKRRLSLHLSNRKRDHAAARLYAIRDKVCFGY